MSTLISWFQDEQDPYADERRQPQSYRPPPTQSRTPNSAQATPKRAMSVQGQPHRSPQLATEQHRSPASVSGRGGSGGGGGGGGGGERYYHRGAQEGEGTSQLRPGPPPPGANGRGGSPSNLPSMFGRLAFPRGSPELYKSCPPDNHISCWAEVDARGFELRGKEYLTDKKKYASKPAACQLYRSDIVSELPGPAHQSYEVIRRLVNSDLAPFFFIVHWRCGYKGQEVSTIQTYVRTLPVGQDPAFDHLLHEFRSKDDTFRNGTLKFLPRIVEGNSALCSAIDMLGGTRPVIIGKKLTTTYSHFPNGIECTINVSSSYFARRVQDLFITGARSFVVDLAFLLEGKRREHLPERLLGAGRMCYVDIPRVIAFQASPATNIDATRLAAVDDDEAAALGAVAAAAAATGGSGHDGSSSSKPSLTKRGVAPYLHSGAVPHGAAAYAAQLGAHKRGDGRVQAWTALTLSAGVVLGTLLPVLETYTRSTLLGYAEGYAGQMSLGVWVCTFVFGMLAGMALSW